MAYEDSQNVQRQEPQREQTPMLELKKLVEKWRKQAESCAGCRDYEGNNLVDWQNRAVFETMDRSADELESALSSIERELNGPPTRAEMQAKIEALEAECDQHNIETNRARVSASEPPNSKPYNAIRRDIEIATMQNMHDDLMNCLKEGKDPVLMLVVWRDTMAAMRQFASRKRTRNA